MGMFSGAYGGSSVSDYAYYSTSGSGSSALIDKEGLSSAKAKRVINNLAQSHTTDFEQISYYLQNNDTRTALQLKDELYEDISNTLSTNYNLSISDDEIDSMLDQAYASYTGSTMMGTVQENTNSSFMTGFLQAIPIFGHYQSEESQAEAVARLSGTKVNDKEKSKEIAGGQVSGALFNAAGGAAAGAAFGAALGVGFFGIGAPVGAAVGAVVGGAWFAICGWIRGGNKVIQNNAKSNA